MQWNLEGFGGVGRDLEGLVGLGIKELSRCDMILVTWFGGVGLGL